MTKPLADSILFSGLDESELALIEQAGNYAHAEKGAFLFFEGDPADRFYIVLSGKVKIAKNSPEGKEQILLLAGPGDSFGEAALFARRKYPATAEVIAGSDLISFSYEKFMALIRDNPSLAVNLIARLSMLLHHLTRIIQNISLEDVSTRLAGYLVDLMPDNASTDRQTILLADKKMFLASLLGTIPETLSRAFARLSEAGLISVEGQRIEILEPERLRRMAGGEKI